MLPLSSRRMSRMICWICWICWICVMEAIFFFLPVDGSEFRILNSDSGSRGTIKYYGIMKSKKKFRGVRRITKSSNPSFIFIFFLCIYVSMSVCIYICIYVSIYLCMYSVPGIISLYTP